MFHVKDGLYFGRKDDGSVRILKLNCKTVPGWPQVNDVIEPGSLVFDVTLPVAAWASVVASVSRGGEHNQRFYVAQYFHNSVGPVAS